MSDQFVGEIRTVGFNFAPVGWALCSGQILPIAQNTALFSLLGTNYGGNGATTFGLPNLNGAMAIGVGQGLGLSPRFVGETGGSSLVTLTQNEIPAHSHPALAADATGTTGSPTDAVWAQPRLGRAARNAYAAPGAAAPLSPQALGPTGDSHPHNNMPPYLGMYFVIALQGIFPARS